MNEPDLRALLAREIARREKLELENESLRRELAACQLELRKAHPQVSDGSVRARLPEVREANAKLWWQSTPSDLCGPNAFLQVGDAVIAHWAKWQFFKATIDSFDVASMRFTVNFADGDQTNREQPVSLVAIDSKPSDEDIGVGEPRAYDDHARLKTGVANRLPRDLCSGAVRRIGTA